MTWLISGWWIFWPEFKVLRTPNAGQNILFQHYSHKKVKKARKSRQNSAKRCFLKIAPAWRLRVLIPEKNISTIVLMKLQKTHFLLNFVSTFLLFLPFLSFFQQKMLKKNNSTSVGSVQHPLLVEIYNFWSHWYKLRLQIANYRTQFSHEKIYRFFIWLFYEANYQVYVG